MCSWPWISLLRRAVHGPVLSHQPPDHDRKSVVSELLEKWGDKPRADINESDRLVEDIHIDGDDFAMNLLPTLHARLGFKAPTERWNTVITVGDVLRIVEEHST